jgi:hypothetical protein
MRFSINDFRMEHSNVHSTFALYIGNEDQSKYFVNDEGITEYTSRDFARLLNVTPTFLMNSLMELLTMMEI